jgi:hypothetical protein
VILLELKNKVSYWNGKGGKEHVNVKLRMDGDYIYYDSRYMKKPNISSHTLVDMLGFNKFSSSGKTIMTMFGINERSQIDPYQIYKGGIVEVFAKRHLMETYGPEADIEDFAVKQFENYNQFPDDLPFSGVLDIMIHMPIKLPVEVKSKEMKDYERIAVHNIYPKDQLVQGANQAVLAHVDKYMMLWGFISPSLSKMLKEITQQDLWIWGEDYRKAVLDLEITAEDIIFHGKIFDVDERLIKAYREKSLKLYNEFYENRRINKKLFSASELKEIKAFIESQNI